MVDFNMKQKEPRYEVVADYEGFDSDFDLELEKLLRRKRAASGYGLFDHRRDIVFSYYYKNAANRAIKKLKKIKRNGLSAKLWPYED